MKNGNGHEMIIEIDERQAKIAKLYVLLITTGEILKSEIKNTTRSSEEMQNLVERLVEKYCAVADDILYKTEYVQNIKTETSRKSSI